MDEIEQLLILQDRDQKIMRMEEELSRVEPEKSALMAKSEEANQHLQETRKQAQQIESQRKDLELEVESKQTQIERYAAQQLETRKNEEYQALAKEIETCKSEIVSLEDRELELMEAADLKQGDIDAANTAAKEAKERTDELVAELEARAARHLSEMGGLREERSQLAEKVEGSLLDRYERLLKKKRGKVVVGVHRGVCGGCHMSLPTQSQVACKAQKEVVQCPNCGRILHYTRDMELNL
ncbi:MAG: C4-type zinc ribbon domain-containing protein [Verrucomicrobiota bacterium]|jgi:predicted  nucleic acid-binding Zn-ribbon protein|nr:C4-type zinc ribbon domain-containing protein [Verrucomicrobiota bacterium]